MAKLTIQRLDPRKRPLGDPLPVQFNPTEFTLTKGAQFAELPIPGLDTPLVQFVNGAAETLTLELFFDSTEGGTGAGAVPVTTTLEPFYRLVRIDGELHAPPVCRISWGEHFPGVTGGSQATAPAFDCVVQTVARQFTLFSPDGVPLRATVTLTVREYKTLEEQLQELNLQSSDHTRFRVVAEGETLPHIAFEEYDDAAQWRLIATHNRIRNARRLTAGQVLELPPRSNR
jgi:nucleoid-associated protein YgaU